jgi:hypothetical protein
MCKLDGDQNELCTVQKVLNKPFGSYSDQERFEIYNTGRPKPNLPLLKNTVLFPGNQKNCTRHFNTADYEKDNLKWLCGCDGLNRLFCWPCLLFGCKKTLWNTRGLRDTDLRNYTNLVKRHCNLLEHKNACITLAEFRSNPLLNAFNLQKKLEKDAHNANVENNRNILKRLIDCIFYLCVQGLPLRGHREGVDSNNRGNYVELLLLLAHYDELLWSHFTCGPRVFQGTSNHIQNDLIHAIASVVRIEIKQQINNSSFVSILLDETTDFAKHYQLSTVLRYCHQGVVYEQFIGFHDVSADRTASALFIHVNSIVAEYECSEKLIGQWNDGAAVMSGE